MSARNPRTPDCAGKPLAGFSRPALEHFPLESRGSERRENARAFESGAISSRPAESTRSASALERLPAKRTPVSVAKLRQTKNVAPVSESTRPESALVDFRDAAIAILDDVTATHGLDAADVLAAVANLVSAITPEAGQSGQSLAGIARKLAELEAQLLHGGRTDPAVTVKRALDQIDGQLEHIPLKSSGFERQEYAPAFEAGAISCRPGDSTRWTSALGESTVGEPSPADPGRPIEPSDPMSAGGIASKPADALATSSEACGTEAARSPPDARDATEGRATTSAPSDPSNAPTLGSGPARTPADPAEEIAIAATIESLTIRMAAVHRQALQQGALEAGPGGTHGALRNSEASFARGGSAPETGGEIGAGETAIREASDARARMDGHLRRLETKIDALARRADTEAAAAFRHHADLIARRIEATQHQLAKRLDTGLAAASVETGIVEDMLWALAARCDIRGDPEGTVATLEQSLCAVRDQLDRLEERLSSLAPAPVAGALERTSVACGTEAEAPPTGPGSAHSGAAIGCFYRPDGVPSIAPPTQEEATHVAGASLDAIAEATMRIADRLSQIEARLSSASRAVAELISRDYAPSPALPWSEVRPMAGGHATGQAGAAGAGSERERTDPTARRVGPDPDTDTLIEPGTGFTPPLQRHNSHESLLPGPDGGEGGSGRTDFIESGPSQRGPVPAARREGLGATAMRRVRRVWSAIFSGSALLRSTAGERPPRRQARPASHEAPEASSASSGAAVRPPRAAAWRGGGDA
jgi:hypothetical protein